MRTRTRAVMATAAIALTTLASGCGSDHGTSVAHGSGRAIAVAMTDNAYAPTELRVGKGETVTFTFTNNGTVTHEAVLGDDAVQMEHHDEMTGSTTESDGDDGGHDDGGHDGEATGSAGAVSVEPGGTGELTHTFGESGTILIGCHEPGHWEAGMKADVTIG